MKSENVTSEKPRLKYEQRLEENLQWALREGSMHFEKESAVHKTLVKIARRLEQEGIPYAIAGGMAMFFHGYRRFTEDVDILITRESLARVHEKLEGLGYLSTFQGSKNLRDTESGVRIDFIITGDFPGDGKPKPVSFPNPTDVGEVIDGVMCVSLPKLVELKLAAGTASDRRRDLGDVQELIRTLNLPSEFVNEIDPSVQEQFRELWNDLERGTRQR